MKTGRNLTDLAQELERQLATKKDLLVPTSLMHHRTDEHGTTHLTVEETPHTAEYDVRPLARQQLADKLRIPFSYFERMRAHEPALLDRNVNTWLQAEDDRRLIRIVDGQVRAVLSDRYRRLDNYELVEQVLPILQRVPGLSLVSQELTETRMYLKAVTARVDMEIAPGDIVQAGIVISNSEVGHGSLAVQPLVYRLLCRNGLIAADQSLRKTHIGRVLASEQEAVTVFRDDTLAADDRAVFLKVRDVVEAALSESTFRLIAQKLQRTLEVPLLGDPVKAVECLAQRYGLNDHERGGVLRHFMVDGNPSAYGLVNAVTRYSQEVADYDRATEFEALGGKLIELSASEWQPLVEAG